MPIADADKLPDATPEERIVAAFNELNEMLVTELFSHLAKVAEWRHTLRSGCMRGVRRYGIPVWSNSMLGGECGQEPTT
jgi:hypothetical protein